MPRPWRTLLLLSRWLAVTVGSHHGHTHPSPPQLCCLSPQAVSTVVGPTVAPDNFPAQTRTPLQFTVRLTGSAAEQTPQCLEEVVAASDTQERGSSVVEVCLDADATEAAKGSKAARPSAGASLEADGTQLPPAPAVRGTHSYIHRNRAELQLSFCLSRNPDCCCQSWY